MSEPLPNEPEPVTVKTPMKVDVKTIVIGVLTVLGALGYGGIIPPAVAPAAAAPCSADPSFQTDVRSALAKLTDQLSDLRERTARVEAALSANR